MNIGLSTRKLNVIAMLSILVVVSLALPALWLPRAAAQTGTFTFTAEGDIGGNSNSSASLQQVANAGGVFSLAVGDLGYVSSGGEGAWCNFVKNIVGSTFPFELIAGNHEDDGQANGFIGNYAACLPDRMGSTGAYGAEYYFDYNNARIIMAAADSSVNGVSYNYNTVGSARYNWMQARIQEAKAAGKWVIVGVHKNCITPGTKSCELGQNFVNLIHTERVDLFLQGHDHIYGRTKQLTCATAGSYNAACVVDTDDAYTRGAGTVTVMTGITGQSQYNINASDVERNYFVKAMGGNGNWNWVTGATNSGRAYGVTKVTVASDRIDVVWLTSVNVVAGWGGDSFSIVGASGPTNTPAPPTSTRTNTPVPPTATVTNTPGGPTNTPVPPTNTPTRTSTPSGGSTTISFQNGVLPSTGYAGNIDTMIKQGSASSNFGSATALEVDGDDGSGVDKSALIKWDASAIPAGKTVTAATITFRVVDGSGSAYQLYELKRNWVENQATWNIFSTGNNWQTAGALGANDRGSTVLGATGSASANTFYTITLNASGRAVVQNWINNPGVNFGLILANASSTDGLDLSSSEASTTTYRPKLTVTYQ